MAPDASTRRHARRHRLRLPLKLLGRLWHLYGWERREPEAPGVATGRILLIMAGWAIFASVAVVGFGLYVRSLLPQDSPAEAVHGFPAPQLQVDPAADYDRLRAVQEERLHRYAWIDRDRGLVSIPIDRAMAILASRGGAALAPLDPPDESEDARGRAVRAAREEAGP